MAERHMSNDEFFSKLTTLLANTQKAGHGSVYLTQKRLTYSSTPPSPSTPENPLSDLDSSKPSAILVRATNGKSKEHRKAGEKVKLSTIVQPDGLEDFFVRYADACKVGMQSLKKRDRSKRKKGKDKKKSEKKA